MSKPGDDIELDVGRVWRLERVSCPHVDVLRAYLCSSLSQGAMEFVKFHLETSRCPYCCSTVDELVAADQAAAKSVMSDLRDKVMRSTRLARRQLRG